MLQWFDGFDWWTVALNMGALVLIPLLFALYGGVIAAQGFKNYKRRKEVRRNFWALFVVGVMVITAQQLKAAKDAVPPDVKLTLYNPQNPNASVSLVRSRVANTVDVDPFLWDLDAFNDGKPLPTKKIPYHFIKENQPGGRMQLLVPEVIGNPVKPGHRIFGFVSVSCADCSTYHAYWVYFIFDGQGGWYAETPKEKAPQLDKMVNSIGEISTHADSVLLNIVPLSDRNPIL